MFAVTRMRRMQSQQRLDSRHLPSATNRAMLLGQSEGSMTGFTSRHDLFPKRLPVLFAGCLLLVLGTQASISQVIIMGPNSTWARYAKLDPTRVDLQSGRLTGKTRQELIRYMHSEQGFAVRPVPKGSKGLVLVAN